MARLLTLAAFTLVPAPHPRVLSGLSSVTRGLPPSVGPASASSSPDGTSLTDAAGIMMPSRRK